MASLRLPVAPPPQQQQVQDPAQHIDVRASQSTTPTPRPLTKRPRIEQYYEPGEPLRVPSPKLEPHSTAQGGELGKQGKYMAIAPQRVPQVDQTSVATVSDPIRTLVDVHVAPARMQLEAGKASSDHSFDFAYHADLRIGLDKAVEAIDKDALKHTTFNEGAFDMSIECRSTDLITSLDMAALATFFDAFVSSPVSCGLWPARSNADQGRSGKSLGLHGTALPWLRISTTARELAEASSSASSRSAAPSSYNMRPLEDRASLKCQSYWRLIRTGSTRVSHRRRSISVLSPSSKTSCVGFYLTRSTAPSGR